MSMALRIWMKELRDTVRDRRTLYAMVIMPLALYPLLLLGLVKLAAHEETKAEVHVPTLAVQGADQAPALVSLLHKSKQLKVMRSADARAEVKAKTADVGLIIPDSFQNGLERGLHAQVTIIIDSLRSYSQAGEEKLRRQLLEYRSQVVARRLGRVGADPAILKPFAAETQDTATREQRGGKILSYILPIFIIIWAIAGGMYTAIDVTAGEKERKTLESLLLTPASRTQIVLGKFLAVSTTSIVAVALSLISLALSARLIIPPEAAGQLSVGIGLLAAVFMLIPGALVACMFAALLIAVCICAKSYKEAQAYVTPIFFAAYLPTVALTMVRDYQPGMGAYVVPLLNTMLLFKELLVGVVNWAHIALTIASLVAFAAGSILLAAWVFGKESMIFRS
jgi:sodium transport system permease protein